eukprot:maker-scaffold1329_size47409-snap-gene-0.14 protein:Tk08801 transcript:maker-scaffold1329_size47409-snap-gene-0.14-mRNA-1 annotation:"discoidin domain-containing receptor 2 isoform x7"
MESGDIKDTAISASSSYEDSTVGPHNARVRVDQNGGAWCPKNIIEQEAVEWLAIDLGSVHALTAVETQGRFGNGLGKEFAEAYILEYYRPRLNKWVRYRTKHEKEVLTANTNTFSEVKNELHPIILAQKIRFHPHNRIKRTICMRVELYGCRHEDALVAYSMPQGDESDFQLYDWTYDGDRIGNQLNNGLGCLSDGNYGPENFQLSYYPQDRGWVGWKRSTERDWIEIDFEFDQVREFHHVQIFTNNQFTWNVTLFQEARLLFSIGGEIYPGHPVISLPMKDSIFELPRNVSIKLHRRIGQFVRLQLFFASKWIMISEVSFESSPARGNFTQEAIHQGSPSGTSLSPPLSSLETSDESDAFMPIVIGVLTVVILVLTAVIFVIVRYRKQSAQPGAMSSKMALHYPEGHPLTYVGPSDSGSMGGSSGRQPSCMGGHLPPPQYSDHQPMHQQQLQGAYVGGASPAIMVKSPTHHLYSFAYRDGTVQSAASARGSRRRLCPPLPRLEVPPPPTSQPPGAEPEVVYTEPANVGGWRRRPQGGYSPAGEDSQVQQSLLLSDASGGDYAVPVHLDSTQNSSGSFSSSGSDRSSLARPASPQPPFSHPSQRAPAMHPKQDVAPDKTSEADAPLLGDPQPSLALKLQSHVVPEISPHQLNLRRKLSEGVFGTVWIADAHGLPRYGRRQDGTPGEASSLVAIKFLADHASIVEKNCVVSGRYQVKIGDIGRDNPIYNRDYVDLDNHLVPIRWMAWESVVG